MDIRIKTNTYHSIHLSMFVYTILIIIIIVSLDNQSTTAINASIGEPTTFSNPDSQKHNGHITNTDSPSDSTPETETTATPIRNETAVKPVNGTPRQTITLDLLEVLFRSYSPSIRPTSTNSSDDFEATKVSMRVVVEGIEGVSTSLQTMVTRFVLVCQWTDANLVWEPSQFGNIDKMLLKQSDLWIPDVVVGNSIHRERKVGFPELPVTLRNHGEITWSPTLITTTTCEFNIVYYPFDSQLCIIRLQTAASFKDTVLLTLTDDDLNWATLTRNGQWKLVATKVKVVDDRRCSFDVYFRLQRRPSYHIFSSILPAVILSSLASLVFALPADCGEKIGLSATVLLAYSVNLTTVADILPETSLQISVFVIYLGLLMALSALSIILSTFVLRAYHTPESTPVSPTASFVVKLLASRPTSRTQGAQEKRNRTKIHPKIQAEGHGVKDVKDNGDEAECPDVLEDEQLKNSRHIESSTERLTFQPKSKMYYDTKKGDDEDEFTWRVVSLVWDRALFRLMSALVAVINVVFIVVMATGETIRPVSSLPVD